MLTALATIIYGILSAWALITALLLLHEYGHIIAMRRMHMKVDKVVMGMGRLFSIKADGMTFDIGAIPVVAYCVSKDYESSDTNRRAWIALAGPAATFLTGVGFLLAYMATEFWLLKFAAQGSLILFATNILPLPPLDGWVVAEHFMAKRGVHISRKQRHQLLAVGIVTTVLVALVI